MASTAATPSSPLVTMPLISVVESTIGVECGTHHPPYRRHAPTVTTNSCDHACEGVALRVRMILRRVVLFSMIGSSAVVALSVSLLRGETKNTLTTLTMLKNRSKSLRQCEETKEWA